MSGSYSLLLIGSLRSEMRGYFWWSTRQRSCDRLAWPAYFCDDLASCALCEPLKRLCAWKIRALEEPDLSLRLIDDFSSGSPILVRSLAEDHGVKSAYLVALRVLGADVWGSLRQDRSSVIVIGPADRRCCASIASGFVASVELQSAAFQQSFVDESERSLVEEEAGDTMSGDESHT